MQTIVLNGTGPRVRVRLKTDTGTVKVLTASKAKDVHLTKDTNLKFAA